ncbi:MAG: glycerate kinase [Bacteroidota bacterium]|nr:glycerate kinase [Odoribacter sp.]MDP3644310.1 glycerate kinase [Bacteroidota bacterium]
MRIVIAPDSFKDCLSATQVAAAISGGIKRVVPEAETICIPMADGGEGTVEALVTATSGKIIPTPSVDALNRPIQSFYGILGEGKTVVIEMAAASGIEFLSQEELNPLIASTYGTGLLLKAAMEAGFTDIIMAIGGSATNDGGAGMAQALGFKLLDKSNNPIVPGGGSLGELHTIDRSNVRPLLNKVRITIACDVRNPLLGPSGATRVYGPQKGATPEMLHQLESNLAHFARILDREFGTDWSDLPGSGAAGGLGFGLLNFCQAEIVPGFGLISQITHLEEHIRKASLVFTGEGKIDAQTIFGKTISGIGKLAKKYQVPVIALCGKMEDDLNELYNQGVTSVFAIGDKPMSLTESKERASELLEATTERIMRIIQFQAKNTQS